MNNNLNDKINEAEQIIYDAINEYNPQLIWGGFSGGYDSLCVTHLLHEMGKLDQVLHLNTGIGIEDTRKYVRNTCEKYNWELLEYKATEHTKSDGTPDPQIYEELIMDQGFPGPPHHWKMYNRLKERSLQRAIRDHKKGWYDKILLCTGVRRSESVRRMGIEKPTDRHGARVWVNPLLNWEKKHIKQYMNRYNLPLNPVVELLCMSGECLCGAFAKEGELKKISQAYPEFVERIKKLEEKCPYPWGWEEGKKKKHRKKSKDDSKNDSGEKYLCHDCIGDE